MQIKSNAYARLNYVDYKSDYSIADKLSHEFIGSKGFVLAKARPSAARDLVRATRPDAPQI